MQTTVAGGDWGGCGSQELGKLLRTRADWALKAQLVSLILLTGKLRFPKLSRNETKPLVLSFSFLFQSGSWVSGRPLFEFSVPLVCLHGCLIPLCLPTRDLTWGWALSVNVCGTELRELPLVRALISLLPQILMSAATRVTSASTAASMSRVASPATAHRATSCWPRASAKVQVAQVEWAGCCQGLLA